MIDRTRRWAAAGALGAALVLFGQQASAFCTAPPGDADGSGVAVVADVQCIILAVLWDLDGGLAPLPGCLGGVVGRGDTNCDSRYSVPDVLLDINYALGVLPGPDLDADGSGCPDACDALCATPADCDDEADCTTETCTGYGTCGHIPDDAACDDGVACNTDVCEGGAPGSGCAWIAFGNPCEDGLLCTLDFCHPFTGCDHEPVDAFCNDGDSCTGDVCVAEIGCTHTVGPVALLTVDPALPIPDADPAGVASTQTVTAWGRVTEIEVEVTLDHTYLADLRLELTSPTGTTVVLAVDAGGSFEDLDGAVFDDDASTFLLLSAPPFDGRYRPWEPLSRFRYEEVHGDWTLRVVDDAAQDVGVLQRWRLREAHLPPQGFCAFACDTDAACDDGDDATPDRCLDSGVCEHWATVPDAPPGCFATTTWHFHTATPSTISQGGTGHFWTIPPGDPELWSAAVYQEVDYAPPSGLEIVLGITDLDPILLARSRGGTDAAAYASLLFADRGELPISDAGFGPGIAPANLVPEGAFGHLQGIDPARAWSVSHTRPTSSGVGTLDRLALRLTTLREPTASSGPYLATDSPAAPIVDFQHTASTATIAGATGAVCDVNVLTGIAHTYPGDLEILLISPEGTAAVLSSRNGGSVDDIFLGRGFEDGAAAPVTQVDWADPPLLVTPEGALGVFDGEPPNGVWTLDVVDLAEGDSGTLETWLLSITTCACGAP